MGMAAAAVAAHFVHSGWVGTTQVQAPWGRGGSFSFFSQLRVGLGGGGRSVRPAGRCSLEAGLLLRSCTPGRWASGGLCTQLGVSVGGWSSGKSVWLVEGYLATRNVIKAV